MKEHENYTVVGASSQESLAELGHSYHCEYETLKAAKTMAKHIITPEFNAEYECNIHYSQVIKNKTGYVLADYFE